MSQSLHESLEMYRELLELSQDLVWQCDIEGRYTYLNPAWERVFGYRIEEMLGRRFTEFQSPATAERDAIEFMRILQHGGTEGYETVHLDKFGKELHLRFYARSICDGSGVALGSRGVAHDISDQVRLRDAESKFRALFEKGPIGVAFHEMIYDSTGKPVDYRFIDANETYLALTGVDPRGKTVLEAFPGIEKDPFDWIGTFGNVAKTGQEIRFETFLQANQRWYDCVGYQYKPDHFVAAFMEVTARKQAEAKLSLLTERLELATRAAGGGIWDFDVLHNKLDWDQRMFQLYGITSQSFSGAYEAWTQGVHPEDRARGDQEIQQALRGEKEFNTEFRVLWPDGSIRHLKAIAMVIRDQQGQAIRMIGTNWDITERKIAEVALQESEHRFADMAANSPGILYQFYARKDGSTGFYYISPKSEEILGMPADIHAPEWQNLGANLHPADQSRFLQAVGDSIREFKDLNIECRMQSRLGTKWIHILSKPMLRGEETLFNGIIMDTTQRKQFEERLQESEGRLRALFTSMTEMVVLHDLIFDEQGQVIDYRITDCNRAYTLITGISKERAVGKLATEVYHRSEPPYLEQFAHVALTGEPYEFSTYYEPLEKHFSVSVVSPKKNSIATITTDITAMQQVQRIVSDKNKELENFLYVTSHDLRSPLVNIQGFSQRLFSQAEEINALLQECAICPEIQTRLGHLTTEAIPKTLRFIQSSAHKMDSLINGLLQISRTGRMELVPSNIDMNALFQSIIAAHSYQIAQISAKVDLQPLPPCYGDEAQLNHLFSNLIDNALKYHDEKRPLRITIRGTRENLRNRYCIQDNGIGIDERLIERVWDVFYRINPKANANGEGLGLSIIKRIVEKHHGKAWIESKLGEGSAFYIELPRESYNG